MILWFKDSSLTSGEQREKQFFAANDFGLCLKYVFSFLVTGRLGLGLSFLMIFDDESFIFGKFFSGLVLTLGSLKIKCYI
jgi:hypothetical protein